MNRLISGILTLIIDFSGEIKDLDEYLKIKKKVYKYPEINWPIFNKAINDNYFKFNSYGV